MMKRYHMLAVVVAMSLALSGCYAKRDIRTTGADFNGALAHKYHTVAKSSSINCWHSAHHFRNKSKNAAAGQTVAPDEVKKGGNAADTAVLSSARSRLMVLLTEKNKKSFPGASADAQVNFDCWANQKPARRALRYGNERYGTNYEMSDLERFASSRSSVGSATATASCREQFEASLKQLAALSKEYGHNKAHTPFVVYFAPGSAKLAKPAKAVITDAAAYLRNYGATSVLVSGYTDAKGSSKANVKLSERRAQAVRQALVKEGVADKEIAVRANGEDQAKGKAHGKNRRVEIVVDQPAQKAAAKAPVSHAPKAKRI